MSELRWSLSSPIEGPGFAGLRVDCCCWFWKELFKANSSSLLSCRGLLFPLLVLGSRVMDAGKAEVLKSEVDTCV